MFNVLIADLVWSARLFGQRQRCRHFG